MNSRKPVVTLARMHAKLGRCFEKQGQKANIVRLEITIV